MCFFNNRKPDLQLIDLHDYEEEALLARDRGRSILPPPMPMVSKHEVSAVNWEKIERNQRLAQEIYNRYNK